MSIFNQFPWTNFREYNLDWVIRTVQDCKETVDAALQDVSNAVAMYFADHIDTTLSVSGDAADAGAVGGRLLTINNTLSNHGGRIGTLENNMIYVYRFTNTGGTLSANAGVDVMDIIHNWQDHEPFMIMIDDLPTYNLNIYLQTGYNDRWFIKGDHVSGSFTYDTYTDTGSISIIAEQAQIVRIKGTAGAYSYGYGDYSKAHTIALALASGGSVPLEHLGSIVYQQSLSTDAYMLKSCKISGTTVYVTFTNDLALTLASDGTIS